MPSQSISSSHFSKLFEIDNIQRTAKRENLFWKQDLTNAQNQDQNLFKFILTDFDLIIIKKICSNQLVHALYGVKKERVTFQVS